MLTITFLVYFFFSFTSFSLCVYLLCRSMNIYFDIHTYIHISLLNWSLSLFCAKNYFLLIIIWADCIRKLWPRVIFIAAITISFYLYRLLTFCVCSIFDFVFRIEFFESMTDWLTDSGAFFVVAKSDRLHFLLLAASCWLFCCQKN